METMMVMVLRPRDAVCAVFGALAQQLEAW